MFIGTPCCCNVRSSKPINIFSHDLFGANVVQILAIFFSNLALQLCMQHHIRCETHQTSLTRKPHEFGLRNFQYCVDCLWGFSGFFLLRHFLFLPTLSITLFPFQSTCRLLSCPYYSLLTHFGSCQRCLLLIWKDLGPNLCVLGIPSVLSPRLVLKTFLCCDNGIQSPGKGELHRNEKFVE